MAGIVKVVIVLVMFLLSVAMVNVMVKKIIHHAQKTVKLLRSVTVCLLICLTHMVMAGMVTF